MSESHYASTIPRDIFVSVRREGWVWIPAACGIDIELLVPSLGTIVRTRDGNDVKVLRPYSATAAPRVSMSAVTGTGPQPMHTDYAYMLRPPRLVMLECQDPGEAECCTRVWTLDWTSLLVSPPDALLNPGWIARAGTSRAPFYTQILNKSWQDEAFIRFDACCMVPPDPYETHITNVMSAFERISSVKDFVWERGSALLLDNWRCLHARGAGADSAPGRRLGRWLIEGDKYGMVS